MISPDRLEQYKDFVVLHSDQNGNYDPEKGLGGLLSVISPDTKLVTLAGMDEEKPYFTESPLYEDVLTYLNNLGIPRNTFPLTKSAIWSYCERRKDGKEVDGSLVEIGAVIKPAYLVSSWGDEKTGYIKSAAGSKLAAPLLPYICEFVYQAGENSIPHRYDSMWRLIGATASHTDQRRPSAVYKVVEFIIQHPGKLRNTDLQAGLKGQLNRSVISYILNSLGDDEKGYGAGIIHYESPRRDIKGKTASGLSTYGLINTDKLKDINSLYKEIRNKQEYFRNKGSVVTVANYILQNPKDSYEANELVEKIGINRRAISNILSLLSNSDIGVLEHQSMFKGGETQSQVWATDLTKMFYEGVLLPIKEVADTLTPPPNKPLDSSKLTYLLQNYDQERSNIGSQGGEEVRVAIINILIKLGEAKVTHIREEYNRITERKLGGAAIYQNLRILTKQERVKRPKRGNYKLV